MKVLSEIFAFFWFLLFVGYCFGLELNRFTIGGSLLITALLFVMLAFDSEV